MELFERLQNQLKEKFGEAILSGQVDYDFPVFVVEKSAIIDVLRFLKEDQSTQFSFLTTLCGLHFPENTGGEFGVMYQLHNMQKNERVRLKIFMGEKDLDVPTATVLWPSANWMERQEFDFFGIRFKGHPDLRRILNMDEMNYHPLRKEYALEDAGRDDKEDKYFGR
jgi:NADH-quinone oxidoreductase subunit C